MNWSYAGRLFDNNIRCDSIVWLAALTNQTPDSFERFTQDCDPEEVAEILKIPLSVATEFIEEPDSLACELIRFDLYGFLVQAATPVPFNVRENGYSTNGFGHYQTRWFYTESFDEAFVERLEDWQRSIVEEVRAKEAA